MIINSRELARSTCFIAQVMVTWMKVVLNVCVTPAVYLPVR